MTVSRRKTARCTIAKQYCSGLSRTIEICCCAASLLALSAVGVRAQSLFPLDDADRASATNSSSASLFTDLRAHNVGDILTITIIENTTAQSTASTKISQNDSVSAFGGTGLVQRFLKDLSLTATNSTAGGGDGTTSRSGTLITTLSVMIKEVLPNNTLRIEGSRLIGINRETQSVRLVGIVRPEDIRFDNTIPSNLIAGVEVHYDGKGIIGTSQRPGILSKIFRFLF